MAIIDNMREYYGRPRGSALFGLDGYVDEVWQVIETRESGGSYKIREKLKDFGELIVRCGEGGVSNEIIRKRRTYGGFCANTGMAAGRLGVKTTLLGMFGKTNIEPAFEPLFDVAELISVGDPAVTQIFEFTDGKLMLPYIQEITGFGYDSLTAALPPDRIGELIANADIVSLGYWSLMPEFDGTLAGLCDGYIGKSGVKRIFFDFADLRKRSGEALSRTLRLINELSVKYRLPMTLSLNEHEAALLFSFCEEPAEVTDRRAAERSLIAARKKTGLDELIMHTPYFAAAATAAEGFASAPQRFCEKPLITTGAGDNFNGGYISACFGGLSLIERLYAGNAATRFYVSRGRSASAGELIKELEFIITA